MMNAKNHLSRDRTARHPSPCQRWRNRYRFRFHPRSEQHSEGDISDDVRYDASNQSTDQDLRRIDGHAVSR